MTHAPDRRRAPETMGAYPERRALAAARRARLLGRLRATRRSGRVRAAIVAAPVVQMLARPTARAAVVSQAIHGTEVLVLGRRGAWSLIETPDGYRGYLHSAALARPGAARRDRAPHEVASLFANVYATPDVTGRAPIAVLPFLSRVEAAGAAPSSAAATAARARRRGPGRGRTAPEAAWAAVRLADGRAGWIQRLDLRPAARGAGRDGAPPAAILGTAIRLLGLPYLWGGTTPFGLDCSGLVQLAHRAHGVVLPRDADLQWADRRLVAVPRTRLTAGDLVFFGPRRRGITHVGIALGPRAFINATTRRGPGVRIDRLDDPYWRSLYRGARRLAGAAFSSSRR